MDGYSVCRDGLALPGWAMLACTMTEDAADEANGG